MESARIPPCHLEAERAVLGAMLRSNDAVMLVQETLKAEDFYEPANAELYSAMLAISTSGRPVDVITLDEELRKRGRLEALGGLDALIELSRSVPSAANVGAYVKIVDSRSTLRKLIRACDEITEECYNQSSETEEILQGAEKRIYDITMRRGGEQLVPIQPVLVDTYQIITDLYVNKGRINGVPTGYTELDDMTTGLHGGEMILIAARPSMGKTAIGMNIVENAAIRCGKKAAVFSLEMPAEQLVLRMLCTEARLDMHNIRRGRIQDDEWFKLSEAMALINAASIHIDATSGLSVAQVRSKARRLQMESGLDLIMIDYLQLMAADGKHGSRQEEVSSISRMIKALAQELNVPVIALSQLSRATAGRSDHRPVLSDIRDSGAIEQDADVVMFLHREDYYNPGQEPTNIAEVIIAKQRNGSLGTVNLIWHGESTWFQDPSARPNEATY
ncbi:MAG: replicative DNA helicase [Clostridiales bacterium]|nr:replicative DNA helicase [Clostridiales bacterium]